MLVFFPWFTGSEFYSFRSWDNRLPKGRGSATVDGEICRGEWFDNGLPEEASIAAQGWNDVWKLSGFSGSRSVLRQINPDFPMKFSLVSIESECRWSIERWNLTDGRLDGGPFDVMNCLQFEGFCTERAKFAWCRRFQTRTNRVEQSYSLPLEETSPAPLLPLSRLWENLWTPCID